VSSHAASADPRALAGRLTVPRVAAEPLATLAFAAVLAAIALEGGGGLQLGPVTKVELGIDVIAGGLTAAAILVGGHTRRLWGALTLTLMGLLVAVTAVSITWAVEPSGAWIEANRTLSYLATMVAGVALVRLFPNRWPSLLGGVVLASVVVCGYALLTKIFPGALNPDEIYARLREPFGYWNAVGLMAAAAGPACLWLGARRSGHAAVSALAYPAMGILFVALLLAYSRGALLALALGCALWFAVVPLRLRGVAVLATSAFCGGLVSFWSFASNPLSTDNVPLAQRASAGHELGIALLAMVIVLLIAGLAIGFAGAQRAPSLEARRQAGVLVLVLLALVPVGLVGALALSSRGLGGSLSNGWRNLTDPHASGNNISNAPDRLTAVGSVRARYWNEALKIARAHKALGVGAGGYATVRPRFRNDTLDVRHAHGYVVQTLADLGAAGTAVSLALLAAWLAAAGRTVGLWGAVRRTPWTPERVGMATLLAVCVVFGVHSFVDWTWFVPGNAVLALLCAGWLVGRGPTTEPIARLAPARVTAREPWRIGLAVAAFAVALVAAWTSWQPQRAVAEGSDALGTAEAGHFDQARAQIARAERTNPLSVDLLFQQAAIERADGDTAGARAALQEAVRKEPANPATWLALAEFELSEGRKPQALSAVGSALYLDPRSQEAISTYLQASGQQ
jgi:O-antigen ligase/polysaccharide polymerase Wzy-like membrane protein/tetratricopeptide repeat protein